MTTKDPKSGNAIKLNGRVSRMRTVPPRGAVATDSAQSADVLHIRSRKPIVDPSQLDTTPTKPRANVQRIHDSGNVDATILSFPKVTADAIDICDTSLLSETPAGARWAQKKNVM